MIGIIPAAGTAKRIHGLPKWALPIPDGYLLDYHVKAMLNMDCSFVFIGGNPQNYQLLDHYAPSALVYIAQRYETMSATVLSLYKQCIANRFSEADNILFSMPDTYFDDEQAYVKLAAALDDGADVAVGVFRSRHDQHNGGMCYVDGERITEVIDKPDHTDLRWIWGVLAWKPAFWDCLDADMPHVGYGLPRAIERGLDVRAVRLEGQYYDCGTFEGYFECLQHVTARSRVVEVASWLA